MTDTTTTRLLIVNSNTSAATTAMLVEAARRAAGAIGETHGREVAVVGATAACGPAMITEPVALANAVEPTVQAVLSTIGVRPHAVIVGAFADPGAAELRDLLGIPVVGIGEAAVCKAAASGQRFAIVTVTPLLRDELYEMVRNWCPAADFAGVFFNEGGPDALSADPQRNVAALGEAIDRAILAGATVVVIGGGPLTDTARMLSERTDVSVLEPVPCAVERALEFVRAAVSPTVGRSV